jgi:glycosyltransferase involved in cell wall biosynthesis
MKIAQVCHKYYPYLGGIETHVQAISEELSTKSHEVTVVTTDLTGKLPKKSRINGVTIIRHLSFAPSGAYHFSPSMIPYLLRHKFDIIHSHGYHTVIPLQTALSGRKGSQIMTTHFKGSSHSPFRQQLLSLYRPLMLKVMNKVEAIICVSETEKTNLRTYFPKFASKFHVIPNGVYTDQFGRLGKKRKDSNIVLCVSRLDKYKGIQYLIKSLNFLPSAYSLRIVGKGGYELELRKLVSDLNLEDRVIFRKNLTRGELLKEYENANVFALLSKYEAFGISVAEALANGLPCIVADSQALSEWIRYQGVEGIRYPIDVKELANKIQNINGKTCNCRITSWKEVAEMVENLYNTVISGGSSRR